MPLAGIEPTIPASERPHAHALHRAASDSRLALNHLFRGSNSVSITFLKFLRSQLVNINQYHLQVTVVYIFRE
jgi:hypothetical protein